MRILQADNLKKLNRMMRDIKVDPDGIKIMRLKGLLYLIKITSVSNIAANILKQEMLSIGGDAAVSREILTGRAKKTDCLIIGNLSQIDRLYVKLAHQPFGLGSLSSCLRQTVRNYQKDDFIVSANKYRLNCRRRQIMGIVNLTPDSFSGDGLYKTRELTSPRAREFILDYAAQMVNDGADIVDVGGESTRPGAAPVSAKEEIRRISAVIGHIVKKIKAPVSIDTYKPEVAEMALDNGAVMINDITGFGNPKMLKLAARYKAAIVIMHMKGMPRDMQKNPCYASLTGEITEYLRGRIDYALDAGIDKNRIIIDPGIGFGKTLAHNLEILDNLREFKVLGYPILIGVSRKSFIGGVSDAAVEERLPGTIAAAVLSAANGANFLRVHDVKEIKQALKVFEAVGNGYN